MVENMMILKYENMIELIDGIHLLQLLVPGTPIIYMGDKLGMTDVYLR